MYTPKPLRVNVFKNIILPSNKSLFGRIPERKERDVLVNFDMDIPSSMSKIESYQFMQNYGDYMNERESAGTDAESGGKKSSDDPSSSD